MDLLKCGNKFSCIYGLLIVIFTLGLFAVSPTGFYKVFSGLIFVLIVIAYQYRMSTISYWIVAGVLLIHHILLMAMQRYQSVSVDVMTPFIINSGFIYAPLLPNPFSSVAAVLTLALHFFIYKDDNGLLFVGIKVLITIIFALLSAAGIQFLRNLSVERDRFYKSSITDPLTGLYTFTYMIQIGQELMDKGQRLTAILINLDDYKNINDTYGYFVGNKVLIQFANDLCCAAGQEAIVGRLSGDEFIVLLREEKDYPFIAKIIDQLNGSSYITDPGLAPIHVGFSHGSAVQSVDEITMEQLIHIADKNMYNNKISLKSGQIYCDVDGDIPPQFADLLTVLSQKDMYTFIHSLYVARFSAELAARMGLDAETVNNVRLAGWLHDIGKIAIPNEILRKPAQLNPDEYQAIKRHVTYGVNLLRSFDINADVIHAIGEHHERYDGKGYPLGKSREEISVEGRILAIADAYSAMTIKRVYRDHQLLDVEALRELEKEKGSQFDPVLVRQFAMLIQSTPKH
jgi:diguanylate cyclase (GGDEF)-like protein/putative nucleotidyltransferase with HDIG domain